MSDNKLRRLPLAAAALLVCFGAQADYTSPDGKFRMSGFGTLGYSQSSTDDVLFNYKGQGGGSKKSGSFHPDSKIAIQGTQKFTDHVSGTAQIMTKYDEEGEYVPTFEWAFLKWQAMPSLAIRGGKMGAPFFMISDFRDVGYANTTVRPSLDVYAQVPVSNFEGVDATYQLSLGSVTLSSSLWLGESRADYTNALSSAPSTIKIKNITGLNFLAEFDNGISVRFGHAQGKLTIDSPSSTLIKTGLAPALAGLAGPTAQSQAQALAAAVTQDNDAASFTGVGITYDQNDIVVSAEYTKRRIDGGYVPETTGWNTTLGYRFGAWLPYIGYSKVKIDDPNATLPTVTVPQLATAAGGVRAILNTQKVAQQTTTIGVRWDAAPGLAVKAQFDRVNKPSGSYGMFLTANPVADIMGGSQFFNANKKINVVTLSVDFVF